MASNEVAYANVTNVRTRDNPQLNYDYGYGSRLPTKYQVQIDGTQRWRNVYAVCFSNAASFYVRVKGQDLYIHDSDLS